jgi:FkbM family methyltransferase
MHTSPESPLLLPLSLRWLRRQQFPRKLGICERLFGGRLAKQGIVWVRTAAGPVWKLDLGNYTHRWIVYGWYQGPALWRWLNRSGGDIQTIVDSGANIGQTVLGFASMCPRARIYAYEPGSAARSWLSEGVVAAGLEDRVIIESAGLGAAPAKAHLANVGEDALHGSWNAINADKGEPILLATLDNELARHRLTTVDFWKLDMEGYELEALRGASHALAEHRIRALYIEVGEESGSPALQLLQSHRYRVFNLSCGGRLMPYHSQQAYDNALCLAPDHPAMTKAPFAS